MSDVVDTLAILGILLVAVWIGFAIMAVQWVLDHLIIFAAVVGVVVLVLAATVRKQQG